MTDANVTVRVKRAVFAGYAVHLVTIDGVEVGMVMPSLEDRDWSVFTPAPPGDDRRWLFRAYRGTRREAVAWLVARQQEASGG